MHDPMTVAWEIQLPFLWRERWRRPTLLTIWHNDPCTDGSDNSCSERKRLGRLHKGLLDCMGGDEARNPWFRRERAKEPASAADAEALLRGALWYGAQVMRLDRWSIGHRRITFADCQRLASELIHNGVDNVRSSLCLLPGWHTNDRDPGEAESYPAEASEYWRRECAKEFWHVIARILSRETARWWHQSRWHVRHWSFQVPLWQRFMRRFFDRCDRCNKRFLGASAFTDWGGTKHWCEACNGASVPVSPERAGGGK